MTKPYPNIVIFVADQWRGDVMGHLGNAAAVTPNLDRLVETEAVSFSRAFCQNPICTPSRCSFMTGWYPHVRGHRTLEYMLQPDEPMLLRTLKELGYIVWWGGKNDVVPGQFGYEDYCDLKYPEPDGSRPCFPDLHSFDDWRGEPGGDNYYSFLYGRIAKPDHFPPEEKFVYDSDWHNVLGAIQMIQNAPEGRPLCLYLPLLFPHPPYGVEDPWYSQIDRRRLPPRIHPPENWRGKASMLKGIYERQNLQNWSEDRWDELRATYYGMCARVDDQFGLIISALRETGIFEDTAVFFFSDHGDYTGDYGLVEKNQNTFEECLVRVPFVIKPPKSIAVKPGVRDALVELIDFPATVEDLLGIEAGHGHYGRSLLPLIGGQTDSHREAVFCEGGRIHGEFYAMEGEKTRAENRRSLYWPRVSWQHSEGPEHGKAVMCRTDRYKYIRRLYEQDELYDLESDPAELHNRIDDPALKQVREQHRERLLTFYLETSDTIPHHHDRRH